MKEGVEEEEMEDATRRYADWCRSRRLENTERVMQGQRFYGPDYPFEEEWSITAATPSRKWTPPRDERAEVPTGYLTGLLKKRIQKGER